MSCTGGGADNGISDEDSSAVVEVSMSFEQVSPEVSKIDFKNSITEDEKFNFFNYEYIYNGGGVAVGDINNDGLTDIYFTGNQVSDKLYLNKGEMVFEDITSSALPENFNEGWHTGVNMVDVNGDGWVDIYVARSGNPEDKTLLQNLLFINNGDNTFSEKGEEYGVNIQKRSTHAAFFDYDNDGDLDLYVLNHPMNNGDIQLLTSAEIKRIKSDGEDADMLLENVDGKFVDVTKSAGIKSNCFGLGVATADFNNDGFIDLYISNDYRDPDFLYMNNGDGSFSNEIRESMQHISNYSMGNDAADFNNDGLMDVVTLDMASEDHIRSKRNMSGMSTKKFWDVVNLGFHHQYMFNALQMNNGNGTFSDVAQLSGVSKTDWSWAPLFADFNNDGNKDLFITNGYRREARDNDYTLEKTKREINGEEIGYEAELALMPTAKIFNYIYEGSSDLKMKNQVSDWGMDFPVNSNGAAFADFDGDGDLDLVLNNMDETSFILENKLASNNNFVRFKVSGYDKNSQGIGVKIKIHTSQGIQYHENFVSRGYQSSVEDIIHFGLGQNVQVIDLVEVLWPNGKFLTIKDLAVNKLHELKYTDANESGGFKDEKENKLFTELKEGPFSFLHKEYEVNDFEAEVLLPQKMSQLGPFASKGDVDGDGMEDVYVSGAANFSGQLFIQENGKFKLKKGPWENQKQREEMDSKFIDVDNDGDLDLYVVSGSNEFTFNSPKIQDQLYINDGKGNFQNESESRLPVMETSGQTIAEGDFDNDGDVDIFVGGRQTPGYYPFAPRSYMLSNDGNGFFTDVSLEVSDQPKDKYDRVLMGPGMVTDALFDDFDGDDDLDLIVVGEWMPVTFFENNGGKLVNVTEKYNPEMTVGWFYSIEKGDFNGDGVNDYIVGNVGENNKFHPSKEKPLEVYCHDFDKNGTYDIVLGKYQNNICYPVRGRQCSSEQMPFIREKFPTYSEFATADLEDIYGEDELDKSLQYSATGFESVVFLSSGSNYVVKELPTAAQISPINQSIIYDFDKDGNLDVLIVGNNFSVEVETIRYDAGRGLLLKGDGKGNFISLSPKSSGFFENNDCKDMLMLGCGSDKLILTFSNNSQSKTFRVDL